MQPRHDNTLRMITESFAMDLNSLKVTVASWDGAVDTTALLKMQQCEDAADAKRFHDSRAANAAKAPLKEPAHAKVLAATQCQEDEAHTQAFTSAANKQSRQMATLLATYDKKVAWMAGFHAWMASQEAEVAKCAGMLAELALTKEQRCRESTECAAELAALALAKEQTSHAVAVRAAVSAVNQAMWNLKNVMFLTPKVLAERPNLQKWWVGKKIVAINNVVQWREVLPTMLVGSNLKEE